MASFRGVHGAMLALESYLQAQLPAAWQQGTINARVTLLGSSDLARPLNGNLLGLYLHRITLDPYGRNRPLPPPVPAPASGGGIQAELPVNLHFLMIANGGSPGIEADLASWAMIALANQPHLDLSRLGDHDTDWTRQEQAAIAPADMTDEDLMRIWDRFEAAYTLTVPYVMRTVRLRLATEPVEGPDVSTRAIPVGDLAWTEDAS
jgi:hypothetical protein